PTDLRSPLSLHDALPIFLEPEHVLAHHRPAAALLPDLARVERRQVEFLPADRRHLLADDRGDLQQAALRQRQDAVEARSELPDEDRKSTRLNSSHRTISY